MLSIFKTYTFQSYLQSPEKRQITTYHQSHMSNKVNQMLKIINLTFVITVL